MVRASPWLARITDTPACRYSLPALGMASFPFHFGIGKIQQGFQLIGFDQRRVVDNDPEPAGQADPGIIRRAELWRDRAVDFPHVQGPENPRRPAAAQGCRHRWSGKDPPGFDRLLP